MSVTGNNSISLRKKDVANQKNLAVGFKKTMFAHKATLGDTGINLSALVSPPEMVGFTNPNAGELLAAQLFFYRKNLTLTSSLSGQLIDYLSYTVATSGQIDFIGFTAADGEIFTGVIDYNARNGLQVVDAAPLISSGTLAVSVTDFNVGQVFTINKYSSMQVGAVIVYRNGVQQFRNSNNSSVTLDGNYYEVNNGSGTGSVIRFNNAPSGVPDNILVLSNGLIASAPEGSQAQAVESLAGQIDAMIPTLAALAGVPEATFQAAPNNVDLKSFGDTVLALLADTKVVAARYKTAAGQSVGVAPTIVDFNTVDYDGDSAVTTGAAWKFTAQVSGYYQVNASFNLTTAARLGYMVLYKNGVAGPRVAHMNTGTGGTTSGLTTVFLNIGDYVDLRITTVASSDTLSADADVNWVEVTRVSGW